MPASCFRKLLDLSFPSQLLERALDKEGIKFTAHDHSTFHRYYVHNRDIPRARKLAGEIVQKLPEFQKSIATPNHDSERTADYAKNA